MKKAKIILRIFFGAFLLIFGLNGFLSFIPLPEMTQEAGVFIGSLAEAGYILPIVGVLEVLVGILLIFNKFTALSLVVIFPIMLNAFLFHLVLDAAGIGGAVLAMILNISLFVLYKDSYAGLFKMNTADQE